MSHMTRPREGVSEAGRRRSLVRLSGFGVLCAVFGLLLWARFLLVTGHPRTAYAEPRLELPRSSAPEARATVSAADHAER